MSSLFSDPVAWSGSMVKSWLRFWLFGSAFVVFQGLVVFDAASWGWRSAAGMAIFLAMFQFMFLYAMRRMYLQIVARGEIHAV